MAVWQRLVRMWGGTRSRRLGTRMGFAALSLATVALVTPVASAHAASLDASATPSLGSFGVDSCTSLASATAELMPTQFYVAELGAGAYSLDCVEQDTMGYVGQDYVHGYWGLSGPNGAADPYAYGQQQAQAAITAWRTIPGIAGITIFADVEFGFGGWNKQPTAEQQQQDVQLLNGFLTTIAQAQFIPGVYINNNDKTNWFPSDYISQVPFVYWVAGGPESGTMCAPCAPICQTLPPVMQSWKNSVSLETFAGQKAALWQYWLSGSGCQGDFNYSPQTGYHAFLPNV
jgi:hypothetical protein